MAPNTISILLHVSPLLFLVMVASVQGGDPDILTDFVVPANLGTPGAPPIDGSFFTYTGMRPLVNDSTDPNEFTVVKASMAEFPALNGQSVSMALLLYPPGSVNPPHTHPRASELLFLIGGQLQVGFVGTGNKLYTQTLQAGDLFVFPKGLVHFQYSFNSNDTAIATCPFH